MKNFNDWYDFNRPSFANTRNQFIDVLRKAYEAGAVSQSETLRDKCAGQAMSGMCANNNGQWMRQNGADWAYRIADAMLESRKGTGEGK